MAATSSKSMTRSEASIKAAHGGSKHRGVYRHAGALKRRKAAANHQRNHEITRTKRSAAAKSSIHQEAHGDSRLAMALRSSSWRQHDGGISAAGISWRRKASGKKTAWQHGGAQTSKHMAIE